MDPGTRTNPPQKRPNAWNRFLIAITLKGDPNPPQPSELIPDLSPLEFASSIQQKFYEDRNYVRVKRRRWAAGAITIRLLALGLSGTATILLGLANLSGPAAWGFALSALVTLITALEPFFNFRARWVSADEALANWHSAEEQLQSYISTHPSAQINNSSLLEYDRMRRDEWGRFSQEWLSARRHAQNHNKY